MMIATLPPARSEDRSTPHWLPDTEPLTPAGNPSNKEKRHLGVSSTKFGALMIYPQKDFNQKKYHITQEDHASAVHIINGEMMVFKTLVKKQGPNIINWKNKPSINII